MQRRQQRILREMAHLMRKQTDNPVHASPVAAFTPAAPPSRFRYGFVIAIIAALFMAVTGALGTDVAPFAKRLTYWSVVMISGHFIGTGVTSGIHGWGKLSGNPWTEGLLISLVIAAPITVVVTGASNMFFGWNDSGLAGLLIMFGIVAFVSMIMTAINIMIGKNHAPAIHTPVIMPVQNIATLPEQDAPTEARLRARLPIHLREAAIWAIESEDHYLRVHTDLGSDLILMRLSDAIAATEGLDGAQTHRSWWVASKAIMRIERGDGRATLHLNGGVTAPVSRTYYRTLIATGWLKSQV
jgi:DNA-binding LytR/AlgR family response regulator